MCGYANCRVPVHSTVNCAVCGDPQVMHGYVSQECRIYCPKCVQGIIQANKESNDV